MAISSNPAHVSFRTAGAAITKINKHMCTCPTLPFRPPVLLVAGFGRRSCPTWKRRRELQRALEGDGQQLATEFEQFVNQAGLSSPLENRKPSHMLPPTAAVAAQMEALQRNDWPEPGAGVRCAFAFAKPEGVDDFLPGSIPTHVRTWQAKEAWLSFEEFRALLTSPPYDVLLGCTEWRPVSNLVFPSLRHGDTKAVLAVEVSAPRRPPAGQQAQHEGRGQGPQQQQLGGLRQYRFTFCLERAERGPYKGCWLTVGVREGDYANV